MNKEAQPGLPAAPVSLLALYRVFFRIGVFSFGGGLVPWIHRAIVEERGWITREQFLSGFAVAQILPGVNSTNLAIFIGQRLRGALGAAIALAGTLTAPLALVLAAAASYQLLLQIPALGVALAGVAAAATGMLLRMGIASAGACFGEVDAGLPQKHAAQNEESRVHANGSGSRVALRRTSAGIVMVATFVMVDFLKWPILPVLAVIIPLSVAAAWPRTNPRTNLGA